MDQKLTTSVPKKAIRVSVILLVIIAVFAVSVVSASAATEIQGKTLAEVLKMDGTVYYRWLKAHESDKYYLTTPYGHADHRNPNGDCKGRNGALDTPGVPAMNCMGFVWHMLYMPTKQSGGNTGMIPAYGKGGWYGLYTNYNVTRRYFTSKKELLRSGYAEPGDIIWCFVENEHVPNDQNHICIYYGDGTSDRVWHSVGAGCVFGPLRTGYKQYIVLKSGVIRKLETPSLKAVTNTVSGAQVNWKAVKGAAGYRVYIKNGSKWKTLGDTKNNYFVDKTAKSGQSAIYTVRCLDRNGNTISGYSTKGVVNTYYAAPAGFYAECGSDKIAFSWKEVEGAVKYRVYRRTAGKTWELVAKTAKTAFTDTNVQAAKMYLYTVRVVDKNDKTVSAYRTPLMGYILNDVPKISDAAVGSKGITLTWNAVKGAEQYLVCKKSGAAWKKIGVSATHSFTYTSPDKNVESVYTVRCLSSTGNAVTSDFDRVGYTAMYQTAPAMTSIEAQAASLKLTWAAQDNAALYRVYRKDNGKWQKIADVAENTYTDTDAEVGGSYTYTLRSVSADGKKNLSYYNTAGWSMTYAPTPQVKATALENGIRITWDKLDAAAKYRLYVKKDGKWTGVLNTPERRYVYTDVADGTEYTFTVRSVDTNKWFNSFYDTAGATATYVDPNPPTEATEVTEPVEE